MPEEKSNWQILVLWVQLLPCCFNLIATGLQHRIHGKELLRFSDCQILFVLAGFAVSFLILSVKAAVSVRANPAEPQKGHKAQVIFPWSCLGGEEDYPDCRTRKHWNKTLQKLEKLSSRVSPSLCCYAYTNHSMTAEKKHMCNSLSLNSPKLTLNPLHRLRSSLQSWLTRVTLTTLIWCWRYRDP